MRTVLAVAACTMLLSSAAGAAEQPAKETVVIVFPFSSPDGGAAGRAFAESMTQRAKRLGCVTVDPLSLKDALAGQAMPTLATTAAEMAAILKERFDARIGIWGEVRPEGDGLVMEVRGMNLDRGAQELAISKTYRAAEKQLVSPVQDEILLEMTGRKKPTVAQATPEADAKVPTIEPELVKNGTFETGDKTPDGWQRIDGLTTFWPAEGQTGKGLRIFTDVYHDQWVKWQEQYKAGATADKAPKATPTTGPKYDTVAGIYGVAFFSDPIPVKPGKKYKVSISYRGLTADIFFPKLFIRGWGKVGDDMRAVYDAYLALRCAAQGREWESNVRIIEIPTDTKSPVEYVRLMIYAYWPPGTYSFDNVSMKEVAPGAVIPK